ncbi:zf-DHHC-domain-containing protein [Chiua virens]|nr:zf-DHHC-domain-containing protein [Chiua virens]
MLPFLVRFVAGFVLFLVVFTSQIFIVWPWCGREWSVELITLLAPFNILAIMLLWNYYLCIFTDPGRVPDGWEPDVLSGDGYEVKKLSGTPRYCRICEKHKPPRSHHCRRCRRCVLRMDHHCHWANNCIGHFNYAHFLRLLFYVAVTCFYHLCMVTRRVIATNRVPQDDLSDFETRLIVFNYMCIVPVTLVVGAFSTYHLHNLIRNTTTIEKREKDKIATLKRNGKIEEIKFPYDLGLWKNIVLILGSNPLLWCFPAVTPGTGLKFQLSIGNDYAVEKRPSRDPGLGNQNQTDNPRSNEDGGIAYGLHPRPHNAQPRPNDE